MLGSAASTRIRVLVADDHPLFRLGMVTVLAGRGDVEVVGEARDGAEALQRVQELLPDVVIVDLGMPGMGASVIAALKREQRSPRVIALAETHEELLGALQLDADGCLTKDVSPEQLLGCLRRVLQGEAPIAPALAAKILREFERAACPPSRMLSLRERQVVELLANGLSNKAIGRELGISEHTVKNHLRSILDKLHLCNRVQAALYAVRRGLAPARRTA